MLKEDNCTIENDKDKSLNIGQIHSMLDEIADMTTEEHHKIIQILNSNNIKYMENKNGIFVKLNTLDLDTIIEIYKYVDDIRKNKINLETAIRSVESQEFYINQTELSNNNSENYDNNNNNNNNSNNNYDNNINSNIPIEDWKRDIIEKIKDVTKMKTKKRKNNKLI
tara:strand:+ start:14962 stop:15462 length:501 start_codon:yes stop_codon:yes gene_type:complete